MDEMAMEIGLKSLLVKFKCASLKSPQATTVHTRTDQSSKIDVLFGILITVVNHISVVSSFRQLCCLNNVKKYSVSCVHT